VNVCTPRAAARLRSPTAVAALVCALLGSAAAVANAAAPERSLVYGLAGRCVALRSLASGRFVVAHGRGYGARSSRARATPLHMEATGLGTFLLYDSGGKMITAGRGVTRSATPGPAAQFAIRGVAHGGVVAFILRSTADHRRLVAGDGRLRLTTRHPRRDQFQLLAHKGCRRFPEAGVDATVHGPGTVEKGGRIFGFIDDHVHVTGNFRAGGDVISGEPFDRFGITRALGRDAKVHGRDGKLDITGNLLRTGSPSGTHDTHGWPTFKGWPTYDSMDHQQAYYVWLERAWRAGMRMMVAQTADDQPLCSIEPRKAVKTCSETSSIIAQIKNLKAMQNYIDAQNGGPGKGWFRLVYSPAQAERVMRVGKLAVMIGIESSDLFGCSERDGASRCTRAQIDRGLARYQRLGVRDMFVAHWVDNAFSGAAFEGGIKGVFINILNRFQTGRYFSAANCPGPGQGEVVQTLSPSVVQFLAALFPAAKPIAGGPVPTYPSAPQCNARGLTPLGVYLIHRMMADHMLIEVDHLSELARDQVLAMAARAHYPLISSHNGTGGEWTSAELTQLYKLGGFAAVTPDTPQALAQKIVTMGRFARTGPSGHAAVGLGTDTNGFSSLPGPPPDAGTNPLHYPFKSYDGSVTFSREKTGTRVFDLNQDGVAQYGLVADLLADMQRTTRGRRAMALLFGSAQAYVDTWRRALARRSRNRAHA
jgi:microsomal dipeptidase-like Zn-dependent dipeptidase